MKKYAFLIVAGLLIAGTSVFAQQKPTKKKNNKVKADTTICMYKNFDERALNDMMQKMQHSSRDFYAQAMQMMEDFQGFDIPSPEEIGSMMRMDHNMFRDSLSNGKDGKMRHPRMHKNRMFTLTDTTGNCQSIVVMSSDGKTTIIRNGKDTTVVNGPFVPERDMPDMTFDWPTPPSFDRMPSWRGNQGRGDITIKRFRAGIEPEQPSIQEVNMLISKGIISSKDVKNNLDVEDIDIVRNSRNRTITISYELNDISQSDIQVVDPLGNVIEKSSLTGQDGNFRRTIRMDKKNDYIFVAITANKKVSICKFWL